MTPADVLSHLELGDPQREAAARALIALLQSLVRMRLTEPSSGHSFEIQGADLRDDLVAKIALKVIDRSPLPVAGKSDGECRRYLATMLVRAHIAEYRKRARIDLPGDDKLLATRTAEPSHDESPSDDALAWIAVARTLLNRCVEHAVQARQARFHESLRTSWSQLEAMVFDQVSFADILLRDENADANVDRAQFVRARNKLFKNHERLRTALRESSDRMLKEQLVSEDEHSHLGKALSLLFRCQNSPASRIEH
ncbi:MAG: hypothetical protein Q8Q09_14150 [Deltaproteobacteria bacterium]|nr:hypothetical protein [Deltaproteobacteria bacterium]